MVFERNASGIEVEWNVLGYGLLPKAAAFSWFVGRTDTNYQAVEPSSLKKDRKSVV